MEHASMKVLVVGANGGSGRAAVQALLSDGHRVTAFVRRPESLAGLASQLQIVSGDAMNAADVERAVAGQDAVIVALGISEHPLRVRLFGPAHTPMHIRSAGTHNVIAAMKKHGVRRLVVQSSFGVGETRDKLPLAYRLFFALVLKPQIADTELQERAVRASGLDWVIAQPVNLTDPASDDGRLPFVSPEGVVRGMRVARASVGRFLAQALRTRGYNGRAVALSAP